jgi:hypothetical protein
VYNPVVGDGRLAEVAGGAAPLFSRSFGRQSEVHERETGVMCLRVQATQSPAQSKN